MWSLLAKISQASIFGLESIAWKDAIEINRSRGVAYLNTCRMQENQPET